MRLGGRPIMRIPIITPTGLARLKMTVERRKFLLLRSDWAMLSPRLKAITTLWTMTAITMETN